MCDVGGGCDVWSPVWVKARKKHTCNECFTTIPPGEQYMRVGTLFEGSWETLYVHAACWELWDFVHAVLCQGHGNIVIGGLWEEIVNYEGLLPTRTGIRVAWEAAPDDEDYDPVEYVKEGLQDVYHEITTHYRQLEVQ